MPALNTIPVDKLVRLIGTPKAPTIIDVRTDDDFAAEPRFIPGAVRRPWADVAGWAAEYRGKSIVVACAQGHKLSQGAAAWLRQLLAARRARAAARPHRAARRGGAYA